MTTPTLGIDISKLTFDAGLLTQKKFYHRSFKNDRRGFTALLKWLSKHPCGAIHVCLESTGVYGEKLSEFLYDHEFSVSVVNPARVRGFAQSELTRTKTDKQDAGLIARFCAAMKPDLWSPQAKEVRELRDLVRRLETLNQMRQQERNRLEAATDIILDALNQHIEFITEQINSTKDKIDEHINNHPDLKHKKALLKTIPGIGDATIGVILSELGHIEQFRSAKAVAAYMGVAPKIQQSGTALRERGVMSKMGRKQLRKAFFMPALVALRYNPVIMELKERLTKAGKPKMLIVGAAMRKLVHIIYGVLKNNEPFRADFA